MMTEKRIGTIFLVLGLALSLLQSSGNCDCKKPLGLIPRPASLTLNSGSFRLNSDTAIALAPAAAELQSGAEVFRNFFRQSSQLELAIGGDQGRTQNVVIFELAPNPELEKLGAEAYVLEIGQDRIKISAPTRKGVFNGAMTLLQVLESSEDSRSAPGLKIIDYPRFEHRGLLLDPARHFLGVAMVKQALDAMARVKMNVLHFHLADDQGWRIESKVFPKLHEVGGAGSYYTQDQLKDLVAYAAARNITIEPEIDLPGHNTALLAAYPELSCSGEKVEVSKIIGIHRNALCPGKEQVYDFLDKLVTEIAGIFPSTYIHAGGDEVMAKDWQDFGPNQELLKTFAQKDNHGLQCYFQDRLNQSFLKLGRRMIVWDELADCPPEGAMVQAWRSIGPVKAATSSGHPVVVSTVEPWYLDYPDWPWQLRRVYQFEPVPAGLTPAEEKLVMGGEGCLWGERAPEEKIMVKLFPRLLAISEVLWSPKESRDFRNFKAREKMVRKTLEEQGARFGVLLSEL